ncbi:PadR family transcriptional regulator PadR [Dysgonomonas alginatilytica]|uniref:PadR family transcriptional regulator PadR n=1 Tax=Dysgonomonas alginatilytica TaxID=1605892 RepID=A0A2V3PIU8_9BACT|nr:PadR family transcriptional regulator [Dysgonomonas alginatilytica]PXV60039.1 PadR family transcriptional regulator PadR [Dysgonomonas alginatilytica]
MEKDYISNWIVQFKKCVLPLIILDLLIGKDCYGYLLIVMIKDHTGFDISEGTIYPILNRLHTEGLIEYKWVEQKTGIPRKYYSLTAEGQNTLDLLKQHWNKINATFKI